MSSKNTHAAPALASQNSEASSTITFIHHGSFFFFVQICSNTLLAIKGTKRENSLRIAVKRTFFLNAKHPAVFFAKCITTEETRKQFLKFFLQLGEVFQMVITNCQLSGAVHTQTDPSGV